MASKTIGWRSLHPEHRRWIAINAFVVTAFVNLAINGLIASFSIRGQ